jgi:hypothetical protein
MVSKSFVLTASIVFLALGMAPAVATAGEVSPSDFALFKDWQDGQTDERLVEDDQETRTKKIAKTLGVTVEELEAAVAKVKVVESTLGSSTAQAVRSSIGQTPMASRLLDVEINTETRHVVAYVKWRCPDKRDIDLEAAYVAWAVGASNPLVNVLGLWCVNEIDTKLFSAQIGRESFTKIRKSSIPRFAASRYIRFFQKIKRGPHR